MACAPDTVNVGGHDCIRPVLHKHYEFNDLYSFTDNFNLYLCSADKPLMALQQSHICKPKTKRKPKVM